MRVLVLIAILATALTIFAEKLPIELYQLPTESVHADSLTEIDGLIYYGDNLYTGVAFEKYDKKQLKKITTYKKGIPEGPIYEWYKDGSNLLSANYKKGRLNGLYMAWYEDGTVIYNLVFRSGKLNFDPQFEEDDSREEALNEESEQDGDSKSDSKEK